MPKKGKELIVHHLLENKSSTVTQISQETNMKYHTTYKLLQKLQDKKVIIREDDEYKPNPTWVKKKQEFFAKLNKFEKQSLQIEQDAYQFTSVFEYMEFIQKVENAFLERNSTQPIYKIVTHAHHFFLDPTYNMSFFKKLQEKKIPITLICYGNSAVDQWTKDNLTKLGAKIILGQGMGSMMVFYIYDNIVLEVLYSHEFRDVLRQTFCQAQSMSDINLVDLHNKLEQIPYRIHVKAITDPEYITDLKMRAQRVSVSKPEQIA